MKIRLFLYLNLLIFISLISCNYSKTSESDKSEIKLDTICKLLNIIYSSTSPYEFFSLIKDNGNSYNEKLIFTYKSNNFSNKTNLDILFGIITFDAFYKYMFNKSIEYECSIINEISTDLAINKFFDFKGFNINSHSIYYNFPDDCGSLMYLTAIGFNNLIEHSKNTKDYKKNYRIMFGYWIENIYITAKQINEKEKTTIAKQAEMVKLFNELKSLMNNNKYSNYINDLKNVFDKVNIKVPIINNYEPKEGKIVDFFSETEYEVSDKDYKIIKENIIKIRELMIKDIN